MKRSEMIEIVKNKENYKRTSFHEFSVRRILGDDKKWWYDVEYIDNNCGGYKTPEEAVDCVISIYRRFEEEERRKCNVR